MKKGDRVSRQVNLDNGRWARLGDKCLPGPKRFGKIEDIEVNERDEGLNLYVVRFEDGSLGKYFSHGIHVEAEF